MQKRALTIGTSMVLLAFALIAAQADPGAKRVDLDLSSPKAAVKSLGRAVDAQEGEVILKIFYTADDAERELAKAFSELILSGKKLGDAAREQYGSGGDTLGSALMSQAEFAKLDQAEVKENGDSATLTPVGQSRPIRFHRTGTRWQLVIRDFANADDSLPRQVALLKKVSGVFTDMTDDIKAGKYGSSQEAEAAIQTKLANVMIRAATQATSKPATKP
jgi:hypothetical protein